MQYLNEPKEFAMRTKYILAGLMASTVFMAAAVAQNAPQQAPARAPTAQSTAATPMKHPGHWRSSKMIGLNVYNNANEKIGDINEILLDPAGKVAGVVIGVGGFLGMGEHDVLVKLEQIKFVSEPVRSTTAANQRPAGTAAPTTTTTTTGTATTNRPARAADEKWYPDHAVMNATKDQLKAMPQFKYSNYN
jgi:sporulation protein YlmC with PRC-barrel domain